MTVMISFNSHHLCKVVTPKYVPNLSFQRSCALLESQMLRANLRLVLHLSQGGHDIDRASLSSSLLNSGVLQIFSIPSLVRRRSYLRRVS
jgi:hypothetical protein